MTPNAESIKVKAFDLGFHKVGIARADALDVERLHLKQWLERGFAADMAWMHDPRRQDIQQVLPGVRSVIVVAMNYNTPQPQSLPDQAQISRYAQGRDYHKVLGKPLKALARWIESEEPQCRTLNYCDTGPIQEKAWAQAAGLGWIGKNACLITLEYGSWVFLGVVLTTLELEADTLHVNHCGTCVRCLNACPTKAIVEPAVVDARLCLAYHTIENRAAALPEPIARNQKGWVVGCDLCQTCCPYNQRAERQGQFTDVTDFKPRPQWRSLLSKLAEIDDATFDAWSMGSAVRRVKAAGIRRNAESAIKSKAGLREADWAE